MKEEAECIAEYLIGTDQMIHSIANEIGIDMDEFYRLNGPDYLYDIIDQCDNCGYWYYINDMKYIRSKDTFLCESCYNRERKQYAI